VPYRWLFPCIVTLMEEHLRRAMLLSRGDWTVFFTRPISLAFMIATALILVMVLRSLRQGARSRLRSQPALWLFLWLLPCPMSFAPAIFQRNLSPRRRQ
jgi:hypothetical protein